MFLLTPPMALAAPPAQASVVDSSVLNLVFSSDPIVQAVLIILIAFSVVSWAIIFFKAVQVKRAQRSSRRYFQTFDNTASLEEFMTKPVPQEGNPLSSIFSSGMSDILRFKQQKAKVPNVTGRPNLDHIQRNIQRAQNDETHRLEQLTPFLATTASAAPFIGLFGTVWGILMAFIKIGQLKSTSLAVVGPYIGEALIATAVGLGAAIPAVIAYNFFVSKIRSLAKDLTDFSDLLGQKIEKEYF